MNVHQGHTERALLIDYGGVLTTSIAASFRAFCEDENVDGRVLRDLFTDDDSPIVELETGRLDGQEFDALLAARMSEASGVVVNPINLKARMFAQVRPDVAMRSAVIRARAAGIPTVLVSNSWGDDYPMDELEPLFDHMLISGRLGMRKPDPEIYLAASDAAGVPPPGCVFVDDLTHNIEGARAVGMVGLLHDAASATIPLMADALGIDLGAG